MLGQKVKTCEVCGNTFQCGGIGCWCTTVSTTRGQRRAISLIAKDCICHDCMNKATISFE